LFVIVVLSFTGMGARLVMLQVIEAPAYARLAANQREREVEFPARRGAVFDRDGEPLAISVDLFTIFADPSLVEDPADAAARLAPVLRQKPSVLEPKLRGTWPGDRFEILARQAEPGLARVVRSLEIPGVYMETAPKRYYPNAELASHVLGFVDLDGKGLTGVELQYERILKGTPGKMILEQDPSGRPLPQAEFEYERAEPGRSLFLTLDKEIQYYTEQALTQAIQAYSAVAGTAIVMRPDTGEILALANAPTFDPNEPGKAKPEEYRNRGVTDMYEPGSAFKVVTVSGALEERAVKPRTTYVVPESLQVSVEVIHDSHSHATEKMTVAEIIKDSSNVGTVKIGMTLGEEKLDEYVRRFGFGTETGLDFPGESGGIVLDLEEWSGVTIGNLPIGQGIAVTPLQMALAYSTIANDGVWVEPKIVYGSMDERGGIDRSRAPASRRIISPRTAHQVTKMLTAVVEDGTGVAAQVPGYTIAGKTGTAQKPLPTGGYGNSYVASFAGYAPARDPQLVTIVVLDEPRPIWGGHTAAPTFQKIMEFSLRHLGISPSGNAVQAAREIEEARAEAADIRD
jgi:cell division protein FtsI (penicillin-binding protein 3)